ncbi:MAG TPA: isoaspartyl peptidase/L-asparaginase [Pirellulales bacterium]|nr:isoaspartyl peptidase/L-asparaginase [Pirellulales bacterium]
MKSDANPDRRCFLKVAGALVGAASSPLNVYAQAETKLASGGKGMATSPMIVVHGGYTHQLPERPEDLQAAQDMLALITAQAEDYLLGRSGDGRQHDAADTARYAVELLEASRIFNAGIGARFQRDGDIRRTAAIMARSAEGMPVSGSIEVVPGVINPITIAYARFLEARRQGWAEQTAFTNAHLSGGASLEYLLASGVSIPGMKTGYQATARRRDELLEFAKHAGDQAAIDSDRHAASGTVGCVVMDTEGRFAAATSTGGTANNVPGRVGDAGTAGGTFASHQGAASMTGDGEGIRNLAMACGLVGALDFTDVDGAAQWMFRQAREKHVSAAAIFIGRGKGDQEVEVRCTDSDAALTFAYSRGDGNVQVFTANPAQYFTSDAELLAAKLGKEYRGFAKSIGSGRETIRVAMTPDRRQALDQSVERIKNLPENLPVAFLPPQAIKGVVCDKGAIDMRAELAKVREAAGGSPAKGR